MGEKSKRGVRVGDWVRTMSGRGVLIERGWIKTGKLYQVTDVNTTGGCFEIRDEEGDKINILLDYEDGRLEKGKEWEIYSFEKNLKEILK